MHIDCMIMQTTYFLNQPMKFY